MVIYVPKPCLNKYDMQDVAVAQSKKGQIAACISECGQILDIGGDKRRQLRLYHSYWDLLHAIRMPARSVDFIPPQVLQLLRPGNKVFQRLAVFFPYIAPLEVLETKDRIVNLGVLGRLYLVPSIIGLLYFHSILSLKNSFIFSLLMTFPFPVGVVAHGDSLCVIFINPSAEYSP